MWSSTALQLGLHLNQHFKIEIITKDCNIKVKLLEVAPDIGPVSPELQLATRFTIRGQWGDGGIHPWSWGYIGLWNIYRLHWCIFIAHFSVCGTLLHLKSVHPDNGWTDREQIRSRIANNWCRTFWPHWPLSTVYSFVQFCTVLYSFVQFCTQLTKAYVAETSCISCYWFCYVSAHDQLADIENEAMSLYGITLLTLPSFQSPWHKIFDPLLRVLFGDIANSTSQSISRHNGGCFLHLGAETTQEVVKPSLFLMQL